MDSRADEVDPHISSNGVAVVNEEANHSSGAGGRDYMLSSELVEDYAMADAQLDAASKLEELAEKGSGVLRTLLITSRAILAAGSSGTSSQEYTYLVDEDILTFRWADQHRKLCERYLCLSKELKEIVAECETCGENIKQPSACML